MPNIARVYPRGFVIETGTVARSAPAGFIVESTTAGGATEVTMTGPTSGYVTLASTNFTISVDTTPITGTVRVTPATDQVGDGTFSPTYIDLTTGSPTGTFTYTPTTSNVTHTISATNDGGLTEPADIAYVVSPAVQLTLVAGPLDSTPAADLTGLKWAWFDDVTPDTLTAPTDQGSAETTNGSGVIFIGLPNTTLATGDVGWLLISNSDGTTAQSPPAKMFSGPVDVL